MGALLQQALAPVVERLGALEASVGALERGQREVASRLAAFEKRGSAAEQLAGKARGKEEAAVAQAKERAQALAEEQRARQAAEARAAAAEGELRVVQGRLAMAEEQRLRAVEDARNAVQELQDQRADWRWARRLAEGTAGSGGSAPGAGSGGS